MDANSIRNPNRIQIGQRLRIPAKASVATPTPRAPGAKMPTATPLPSILPTGRPND